MVFTLLAWAAWAGSAESVCLSDGQRLKGTLIEVQGGVELHLADAFVRIPGKSWAPRCPDRLAPRKGDASDYTVLLLVGDQRLEGIVSSEPAFWEVRLRDRHKVFVAESLITGESTPEDLLLPPIENLGRPTNLDRKPAWVIPVVILCVAGAAATIAAVVWLANLEPLTLGASLSPAPSW